MNLFSAIDFSAVRLSVPLALALVAMLGYLVGRRSRADGELVPGGSKRELRRAQGVAKELEKIAMRIRKDLARHHASVARFKLRVGQLDGQQQEMAWKELCQEADEMLTSTLQLGTQIANAHDQLRQQTSHLMAFTAVRADPLTGINNRRGLEDSLAVQLGMFNRYEQRFSLAIFDIDHFKQINDEQGHLQGDIVLQRVAKLLDESARETDTVARYGGEEFVVVMPQTSLEGACNFAERYRGKVAQYLSLTVSGGVTAVLEGDTAETLLGRADAALYAAKSAGRNCVLRHDGQQIESICEAAASIAEAGILNSR